MHSHDFSGLATTDDSGMSSSLRPSLQLETEMSK